MTKLMDQAIRSVQKLSSEQQDELAEILLTASKMSITDDKENLATPVSVHQTAKTNVLSKVAQAIIRIGNALFHASLYLWAIFWILVFLDGIIGRYLFQNAPGMDSPAYLFVPEWIIATSPLIVLAIMPLYLRYLFRLRS